MSPFLLHRRLLSSSSFSSTKSYYKKWSIKQVTKSNFSDSLEEIRSHIYSSDFVAVFLHNTGSSSASWHRVSPFDTPYTAYLKAKYAADRFQILQFAVCPFSVRESKLTAYPYNFHLFPRDELKLGMPSYSFSCQASHLTAMAREGFDFNTCIYDGISYLSRVQEPAAKSRLGNPISISTVMKYSPSPSVADSLFMQRIKLRVQHWKKACTDSRKKTDEALVRSLRKLVLGIEEYGSRPCMTIDVCSENQVQLALEMLAEFSDVLVPLLIPSKGGGTQAVRVVLTSSKEDRHLFEKELQNLEVEQNKRVRGFREVIDLISASQKPVVSLNSLNDFTFIYSKFIAPLPLSMDEFISSLQSVFPHIIDVNQMMKEINPLKKVKNISAAMSYLKNRFSAAVDMEIPSQGQGYIWMVHKTPESDTWDLTMRSHKLWTMLAESLCDQGLDPQEVLGWKRTGSLLVGRTPVDSIVLKAKVKQLVEAGLRAEYLSACDLLLKEPELLVGNDTGAVFLPDDCQLDAHRTVTYIQEANKQFALEGRYAEFYHEPVTGLLRSDNNGEVEAVQTSKNILYSKKAIVVAAGCWTGSLMHALLRELNITVDLPIKPRKGHLLVLENFSSLNLNHGLMEVGYVDHQGATLDRNTTASEHDEQSQMLSVSMTATMDTRGNLVLGSSRQFAGFSTEVDESVILHIWKRVGEFFPKLREVPLKDFVHNRKVRVGLRPYMLDGKPVIGLVPGLSNVFLATGHEGGGLSLAMGTAEMVVDMVMGDPQQVDSAPFSLQGRHS